MKIIQVCPRFYPELGGIETHVYEISKRLAKKHDVYVYTTTKSKKLKKEEVIENIKVKRFWSFAPNDSYFFSPELFFSLKKESCDILHAHCFQAFPAFFASLAFDKNKMKKFIFSPHFHPIAGTKFRTFLRKFYDHIQKSIFRKADKIISASNYEIDLLHKLFKIPYKKMLKIPHGINLKFLKKLPKVKKRPGFQILYVGRSEKYKRIHWIILSLKDIIKKYPDKKIHLTLVTKGPYEKRLKDLCEKIEIKSYVTFKKNLTEEELLKEYCSCDVFVMPSEYEAFGITVLEALACSKPVIVSNVGGLKEFVNNKSLTIESKDDLTKKLVSFMENTPKVNFDIKNYSWDSIVKKIEDVYLGKKY